MPDPVGITTTTAETKGTATAPSNKGPTKAELRSWAHTVHRSRSPEERERASLALSVRVAERLEHHGAKFVVGYIALATELDPFADSEIVNDLAQKGVMLLAPRVDGDELTLHLWSAPRVRHRWGMAEPAPGSPAVDGIEVDVVIVPGLAFTAQGDRLGRGRGFYDRFLGSVPQARRIAIAADDAVADVLATEDHDEPMDEVLTPTTLWVTHRRYELPARNSLDDTSQRSHG